MAQHQAIAAVAAAIRGLLRERYPRDAFDTLTVEMYQAKDIEKGLTVDGFAILPWRVAINTQRRPGLRASISSGAASSLRCRST